MKRHRRSPGSIEVTVTITDSQDRRARLVAEYTPEIPARTWGPPEQCYPAEGGDTEVIEVKALDFGADIAEILRDMSAVEEAVRAEVGDLEADRAAEEAEHRADLARDDFLERSTR